MEVFWPSHFLKIILLHEHFKQRKNKNEKRIMRTIKQKESAASNTAWTH